MKKLLLSLIITTFSTLLFAQNNSYQLSSHILDVSKGSPAKGVTIQLEKFNEQTKNWVLVDKKIIISYGKNI